MCNIVNVKCDVLERVVSAVEIQHTRWEVNTRAGRAERTGKKIEGNETMSQENRTQIQWRTPLPSYTTY